MGVIRKDLPTKRVNHWSTRTGGERAQPTRIKGPETQKSHPFSAPPSHGLGQSLGEHKQDQRNRYRRGEDGQVDIVHQADRYRCSEGCGTCVHQVVAEQHRGKKLLGPVCQPRHPPGAGPAGVHEMQQTHP